MSRLGRWRRVAALLALLTPGWFVRPAAAAAAWSFTNLAALHAYPEFYQNKQIVVQAQLSVSHGRLVLSAGGDQLQVLFSGTAPPDGLVEARGEFWNVGGMNNDDPRLRPDVLTALGVDPSAPWPRSGRLLALKATSLNPVSAPSTATIHTIMLEPDRFLGQTVTLTGQFSGRNLLGELPNAPGLSQWDFVLRGQDTALWVTGQQPKGDGFTLNPDTRVDTDRWLQVTGVVRQGRGLVWVEVARDGIKLAQPPTATETAPSSNEPAPIAAFPPPEAVFSAPTSGETDVPLTTALRIQFSRDLDPSTLKDNITISYVAGEPAGGAAPAAAIAFTYKYLPDRRELDIHFDRPLDRFRTVKATLATDILGADHQPLKPWTVSFTTGG
ncbi:MAG TPA: Ig-like domain-containing protein [Vicinamibacterales bacterium]|jgi:hypothetical protein